MKSTAKHYKIALLAVGILFFTCACDCDDDEDLRRLERERNAQSIDSLSIAYPDSDID